VGANRLSDPPNPLPESGTTSKTGKAGKRGKGGKEEKKQGKNVRKHPSNKFLDTVLMLEYT